MSELTRFHRSLLLRRPLSDIKEVQKKVFVGHKLFVKFLLRGLHMIGGTESREKKGTQPTGRLHGWEVRSDLSTLKDEGSQKRCDTSRICKS